MNKKHISAQIILVLLLTFILSFTAEAKVKVNKSKATISVGTTVQLKIKGTGKKVKWSSSDKKIATVSKKGKVKGKSAGKVTIVGKIGRKYYKSIITVKPLTKKTAYSLIKKWMKKKRKSNYHVFKADSVEWDDEGEYIIDYLTGERMPDSYFNRYYFYVDRPYGEGTLEIAGLYVDKYTGRVNVVVYNSKSWKGLPKSFRL